MAGGDRCDGLLSALQRRADQVHQRRVREVLAESLGHLPAEVGKPEAGLRARTAPLRGCAPDRAAPGGRRWVPWVSSLVVEDTLRSVAGPSCASPGPVSTSDPPRRPSAGVQPCASAASSRDASTCQKACRWPSTKRHRERGRCTRPAGRGQRRRRRWSRWRRRARRRRGRSRPRRRRGGSRSRTSRTTRARSIVGVRADRRLLACATTLDARLLEQLAVLLLRHPLATLLDDRTHGQTSRIPPRRAGKLAGSGRCSPKGRGWTIQPKHDLTATPPRGAKSVRRAHPAW